MQKMSTSQVSTSHTVHRAHHTTPLKVLRRPPRNDVTHAIQTFLPYAVAFLLALMVYTSFRSSSTTEYPPYSPPNMLPEESLPSSAHLASMLNKRTDRLEEILKKAQASPNVQPGHWASWRAQKAVELDEKKRVAEEQFRENAHNAFEDVKTKAENMVHEAADWMKTSTHDFAYDSMYSWKQKVEQFKNAAAEKVEDVKESGAEVFESASQAAFDLKNRGMTMELLRTQPFNRMMHNNTRMSFTDRLSALVSSVKESLTLDTEARQEVDVSKRADMIIQQLQYLGDDVIEEIFRKLDIERSECTCPDNTQVVCPK